MWWGDWRIEAATLLVAIVVDLATREAPAAIHPVVRMGKLIAWLERISPAPGLWRRAARRWSACKAEP